MEPLKDMAQGSTHHTSPFLERRIKRAVRDFRAHLRVDCGFTDDTTYGYGNHLAAAMRRLGRAKLTKRAMRNYLLWMREHGYSYSAQFNSTLAFEVHGSMRGLNVRFGRQPKPKPPKGLLERSRGQPAPPFSPWGST